MRRSGRPLCFCCSARFGPGHQDADWAFRPRRDPLGPHLGSLETGPVSCRQLHLPPQRGRSGRTVVDPDNMPRPRGGCRAERRMDSVPPEKRRSRNILVVTVVAFVPGLDPQRNHFPRLKPCTRPTSPADKCRNYTPCPSTRSRNWRRRVVGHGFTSRPTRRCIAPRTSKSGSKQPSSRLRAYQMR